MDQIKGRSVLNATSVPCQLDKRDVQVIITAEGTLGCNPCHRFCNVMMATVDQHLDPNVLNVLHTNNIKLRAKGIYHVSSCV